MKLRLYHHRDGARIAYREIGTGPPLCLLHSAGLSHREWEPVVENLTDRFRLVLPDLPGHGDSEDGPRHSYSPDWLVEVLTDFCRETLGPRPLIGGHDLGAELLLRAVATRRIQPSRLVLMPNRMHDAMQRPVLARGWRLALRSAAIPGVDRAFAHVAGRAARPSLGEKLSARHNPAARDLVRHAFAGVPGNGNRVRAWAKLSRRWPVDPQDHYLEAYRSLDMPVLLLWADRDRIHPVQTAEAALQELPDAQLRVLPDTGFLMAYDDPVGLARELSAFCG